MVFTSPAGVQPPNDVGREYGAHAGEDYWVPVRYGDIEAGTRYQLLNWAGPAARSIIYHHGSGETNYAARIRKIAEAMDGAESVNIIALSVPFNTSMKEYLYGVGRLDRFVFMLASSVRLIEELVGYLKSLGAERIACAGMSLGGWISNLHHTYYKSCSEYLPIFAGVAPDHLFSETIYSKLLAKAVRSPENLRRISEALNFEQDFAQQSNENVYPCMARYDQFIHFDRQTGIYRPQQIRILKRGHITGATALNELATHLSQGAFA
ncbi:MAG: hypothetical protein K9L66_06185 [Spirochaetaceae bacterium]|nr:hypothetical protein [Spirochaetaceae bacterium]MCF7938857.1 hypothetical protein [Spirochaetales bacterium]